MALPTSMKVIARICRALDALTRPEDLEYVSKLALRRADEIVLAASAPQDTQEGK